MPGDPPKNGSRLILIIFRRYPPLLMLNQAPSQPPTNKKGVFLSGDLYRKLTDACPETENGGILVRDVYTRHLVAVLPCMAFCAYTGRGIKCVGFSGQLEPSTGHTRHRHIQLTFNNPNEHPKTNPKRCSPPSAGPRRGLTATRRRSPSRSQAGGAWNGSTMGPRTRTRAVGCLYLE